MTPKKAEGIHGPKVVVRTLVVENVIVNIEAGYVHVRGGGKTEIVFNSSCELDKVKVGSTLQFFTDGKVEVV